MYGSEKVNAASGTILFIADDTLYSALQSQKAVSVYL